MIGRELGDVFPSASLRSGTSIAYEDNSNASISRINALDCEGYRREPEMTNSSARKDGQRTFLTQSLNLAVQGIGMIVLARMLAPQDFGLIAMSAVFFSLAQNLRDFGLATSTMQAESITKSQLSNMFWVSSAAGLASALLYVALLPVMLIMFRTEQLVLIVPVLSIGIFLGGVLSQLRVSLARDHKISALNLSSVIANVGAVSFAILLAGFGCGYWALVALQLTYVSLLLAMSWAFSRFKIMKPSSGSGTRRILHHSFHLGIAQLLDWGSSNVTPAVIGSIGGAAALGFFDRAAQLSTNALSSFLPPFTQVVIPHIRRAAAIGKPIRDLLINVQSVSALSMLWLIGAGIIASPSLIQFLLGAAWNDMAIVLQATLVASGFMALGWPTYWSFLLDQASREQMRYALFTRVVTVAMVFIGAVLHGPLGVVVAFALGKSVTWLVGLAWVKLRLQLDLTGVAIRSVYFACVTAVSLLLVGASHSAFDNLGTIVSLSAFTALYFCIHSASRFGRVAIRETVNVWRRGFSR